MALGNGCSSLKTTKRGGDLKVKVKVNVDESGSGERLGLGHVKYTRGLGRKRIVISSSEETAPTATITATTSSLCAETKTEFENPLKRQCSERMMLVEFEKSLLESLPQDILIRVLCGVNHEDLKQLFRVSKTICEAALVAKQSHFAYTTPRKTRAFRTPSIDFVDLSEDTEAPNAPSRSRKSRSCRNNLEDVSIALFSSPCERMEQWPRRGNLNSQFDEI